MTLLRSIIQTIPPASDTVHFEIRRQVMRAQTFQDKKRCEAFLPYTKDIAPYSEASRLVIKTYDQALAITHSIKNGKSFQSLVQRVKLGCLGSVIEKVNSNPMILVKDPKRGNLVDGLLKFIELQLPFWNNSKSGYAQDEKEYTLGILNKCFRHDILFNKKNMDLKYKWTKKVDSLGLVDDVEFGFLIRVYTFGTLVSQPAFMNQLLITNEIVPLNDVEELDMDLDNENEQDQNANLENFEFNLVYQNDDDAIINFDLSGNNIDFFDI